MLEIKTSKSIDFFYRLAKYLCLQILSKCKKKLSTTLNFYFIIGVAELITQIKKIEEFKLFFCPVFNKIIKNIIKAVKVISYSMNESEMEYRGTKSHSVKNCVKAQRVEGN